VRPAEDAVIDLGLLAPPATRTPPDNPVRQLRAWWVRRRQRLACALVATLLLVTAAGSAPQLADGMVTIALPPTGYGRFEVVGDLLFVARSATIWQAYELPAGERRWSLRRPAGAPLGLVAGGGLLLDRLYGSFGATRDPATGAVLLSPGQVRASSGVATVRTVPGAETALASSDYRLYRDASPHPRFGQPATGQLAAWLVGDPLVVVRISVAGLLELRAPATGEVLASRALPVDASPARPAAAFDGTLVLQREHPGGLSLQGYDVDTLAASWERSLPRGGDRAVWVERCGPMLCIHRQQANDPTTFVDPLTGWLLTATGTEVVDPATGRTAWVAAGQTQLHPVGDRFLAYHRDGTLAAVMDARTGRPLRQLAGWRALVPVAATGDGSPLVLTRTDQTGHTSLARLDLATLALTGAGVLPGQPDACQPFSTGLVCRHGHRLRVWTL
jgi:hypothetical protein